MTERERPRESEFPHETMAADVCREWQADSSASDGMLVCHLLEGHAGEHWDDHSARWWMPHEDPADPSFIQAAILRAQIAQLEVDAMKDWPAPNVLTERPQSSP